MYVSLYFDFKYSDGTIDSEAQEFLHKLKDEKVPDALNPSNIKNYTVNWGPGVTLEQHADYLRLVWVSIHFAYQFSRQSQLCRHFLSFYLLNLWRCDLSHNTSYLECGCNFSDPMV